MKEKDIAFLNREAEDFFREVVYHLIPAVAEYRPETAGDILAAARQAIADATPEQLEAMSGEFSRFLKWLDEQPSKTELHQSFAKACEDLAGPLKAFLDHPLMDRSVAEQISNALLDAKNQMEPFQTDGEA